VENEVPEAISFLGLKYFQGAPCVAQNLKKAAKIYRRAVELGNVDAFNNLAYMYDGGKGVNQDKKKAMQLYRMAAERGDAVAQCNLGFSLDQLSGHDEAMPWFKMAAEQGYTHAEFQLGICMLERQRDWINSQSKAFRGQDIDDAAVADLDEARRWLRRAAAKGHEPAIAALDGLSSL
jgi:hypothetical protein